MNSAAGASVLAASAARTGFSLSPAARGAPLFPKLAAVPPPAVASAAQGALDSPSLGGNPFPARPLVAASISRAAGAPFWSMSAPAHLSGAA